MILASVSVRFWTSIAEIIRFSIVLLVCTALLAALLWGAVALLRRPTGQQRDV